MMKRLFSLAALLLSLAPFGLAQTPTDTIRFDVEKTGAKFIQYKFSDKVKAGIEIEWISADGASTRYIPGQNGFTANGVGGYMQPISGNGQVHIYYTHASDADPYSLCMRQGGFCDGDINIVLVSTAATLLNVSGCTILTSLDSTAIIECERLYGFDLAEL